MKNLKISIPEPCSEDWSKMNPTEKGAFCQKCALEVTDFTNKSSLEIKSILTEKIESKSRVCGHIYNRQLIEFNHGYIPWKSNQESFRAIWVFSLVAVFGMSLFSCQSTFSKEMVEQMKTSSELLLEDDQDTLDLAQLKDSIFEINPSDSLSKVGDLPYGGFEGPITDGGMAWEFEEPQWEVYICSQWMGDMEISGNFTGPDDMDVLVNAQVFSTPKTPSPFANDRPQLETQPLDAKPEKGKPNFAAHISPIPIDETSKFYLTIPEEGKLKISIWELASIEKIHSETLDLVFGNHAVDINFQDFPEGKYAAQLIWEGEKVVLPFEIFAENES